MLPKPSCGWRVGSEATNGKGVENGRAAGVWKCGRDLEFSGMRKENVLSKAFQSNVATENPEMVLYRFSQDSTSALTAVTAMGGLLCLKLILASEI